MAIRYGSTAILTNPRNEMEVEAEVDNVKVKESLDAYVATNRIKMIWNGKIFVGNAHGMEFTTPGPTEHHYSEGRR